MLCVFVKEDNKLKILHELDEGNEDFNDLLPALGEEKRATNSNDGKPSKEETTELTEQSSEKVPEESEVDKKVGASDPAEKAYELAKELCGGEVSSLGQFSQDGMNYYQYETVEYPKVQIIIDDAGKQYDAYEYNSTGVLNQL